MLRRFALMALDRSVTAIMAHAPNAVANRVAGFVARRLAGKLYPRQIAAARAGMVALRPDLPLDAAMATCTDNMARSMMEVPRLRRLLDEGRVRVHGAEHLAARPLIVAGVHLGNWEVIAPAMWLHDAAPNFVYEPPLNPYRHAQAVRARKPFTTRLLPGSPTITRTLYRALVEERGVMLMFMDEIREHGPNAPSLGRARPDRGNVSTIARLARHAGAPVVMAHVVRGDGPVFDVYFAPAVTLPDDVAEAIAVLDAAAEARVRPNLPQWYFLHAWK